MREADKTRKEREIVCSRLKFNLTFRRTLILKSCQTLITSEEEEGDHQEDQKMVIAVVRVLSIRSVS
jgi:hypothetical protein